MVIPGHFSSSHSLFVTSNGDIYIDDGQNNGRIQKWTATTNEFVTVMNVESTCAGLFVDTNDTLYCSMFLNHRVVKRSLNDPNISSIIVATGTGGQGLNLNQLNGPAGIFVDVNFDLYVADCRNDRVQLWHSGEASGITVAGRGSPNPTIDLRSPTAIVLDAQKYLFIVDRDNHRIVGSGSNGFRCLVGCYEQGLKFNQLNYPLSLSFDRSGNIFVADADNHRIQKFLYLEKSCGE